MTYLLTEEADGPYQVKFISSSTCKTDAPDSFSKLIKQRRRWFLGGFVNDISTLISPVMWTKVPFVVLMKSHFYSSKGVDWIFPILIISIASNQNPGVALYLLVAVFFLRYLLLCLNALVMTRTKVCASYIFLFFLSPFFNWIVTVYAVWTWSVRSWGGPRTDEDDSGRVISPINKLDEAMAQKEEGVGQTRRSLAQIQTISKVLHDNFKGGNGSIRSTANGKRPLPPLKKYVPFPYQAEFLGGGGFEDNNNNDNLRPPPSPTMSLRSLQLPIMMRNNTSTLSPTDNQSNHHHHSSMPDIHALSASDLPYVFAQLDPNTLRRASSFTLDTEYLAKFGDLLPQDSEQKDSSFNMRLARRTSPSGSGSLYGGGGGGGGGGTTSREPSVYSFQYDSESKASSSSFDLIDEDNNYNSLNANDGDNTNSFSYVNNSNSNYNVNSQNSPSRNIPQINIVIDSVDD